MSNELKSYIGPHPTDNTLTEYYLKSDADKVIAEKDKEILDLIEKVQKERAAKVDYKISANDLRTGLEKAYEEIRMLRRALWLARAMRAEAQWNRQLRDAGICFAVGRCKEWDKFNTIQKKWQVVERKCIKKAEEYK